MSDLDCAAIVNVCCTGLAHTLCLSLCETRLHLCEGVTQPSSHTVPPAGSHKVLLIPVSEREVRVVCGGVEENEEKVSG